MRMLAGVYVQGGANAVRQMLKGQAPEEVIEQIISDLENMSDDDDSRNAASTLPDETVNILASNTYAIITEVPDERENWQQQLQGARRFRITRG